LELGFAEKQNLHLH